MFLKVFVIMSRYYKVFSLFIKSQIFLPEAAPAEAAENYDAEIVIGSLSDEISADMALSETWLGALNKNNAWMRTPAGDFQIQNGSHVTVSPASDLENDPYISERLRIYLMGTVMAVLLIQRGMLPVHGGALLKKDGVMIVTGDMGAGKSTVVTALSLSGLPFLADDVSVLCEEAGVIRVLPAYPQRKLCGDAALRLGFDTSKMVKINERRDKFVIRGLRDWHPEPEPLRCIIEIVVRDGGGVELQKLSSLDKLKMVHKNIYRPEAHRLCSSSQILMNACAKVAAQTEMYRVYRPAFVNSLEEMIAVIEAL